jgi:protein gp37
MAYEGGEVEALKSFTAYPPSGRVIAVQFMGDLWHTSVLQSYRDCILSTISQCPESVFLLLTKRPHLVYESIPSNAWMGASCHDERSMSIAMKILSKINARNLWISVEPLISPVAVMPILAPNLGFIAVGPETIGGKEIQPGFTDEFINACGHVIFQSGVTLYDKRKNWTVRDWPGAWKDLKKGNG